MSSRVFQGQSCLQPRTAEPLVLRLKLTPLKSDSDSENKNNNRGWNFIQEKVEKVYVHPMANRSKLNEKSLEMCTESLGSETGCDISETMDDNYSSYSSSDNSDSSPRSRRSKILGTSCVAPKKRCLPPPLTSISGSGGCVQVKTHREGGRLVMRAVTISSSPTLFHAQRENGRLRLHLFKSDSEHEDDDNDDDDDEELEEESDVEDETEESDDSVSWGEDMDGDGMNVGGNMGINNFQYPTRCKDGLWNIEASWIK